MRDEIKGKLDYFLRPGLRDGNELFDMKWRGTGPFNGQPSRQHATWQLLSDASPSVIVETGTYRGDHHRVPGHVRCPGAHHRGQ